MRLVGNGGAPAILLAGEGVERAIVGGVATRCYVIARGDVYVIGVRQDRPGVPGRLARPLRRATSSVNAPACRPAASSRASPGSTSFSTAARRYRYTM